MIDQNILKLCMKVNGVKTYHPIFEVTSERGLQGDPSCIGKFCWNNGRVAFVTRDGSYYVTPYCFDVADYLRENGYVEGSVFVPFSNGEVPEDENLKTQWKTLVEGAKALHAEREAQERANKCAELARQKGLEPLPSEAYDMCIQVPKEGLVYSFWGEEGRCYPVEDYRLKDVLGTYCQNNGRVVFVDDKGNTYVTPFCEEIRNALSASRYREGSIYVPLSNGEELLDPSLNAKWKNLTTAARQAFEERRDQERIARNNLLARQKGLSELSPEVYEMCLHIPQTGLQTTRWGDEVSTIYPLDDYYMKEHLGTYTQNNGRVVFIDTKGEMYVTPYCEEIRAALTSAGYKEGSLFVPLSNGETPVDFHIKKKWDSMSTDSREKFEARRNQERKERLEKLSKEKGLVELPKALLEISLEIPSEGLETSWMGQKPERTFPVSGDYSVEEAMGTYTQNNGRVVFVDVSGKTYVTPFCYEARETLKAAGYKEGSLYVPLSNGEVPINPEVAAHWQKMCEKARELFNERVTKERLRRCADIAEKKHIGSLPQEVYELSLEIPETGIPTSFMGQAGIATPVSDYKLEEALGLYCQNNGRVVFVDDCGKTFVTPFCPEVRALLEQGGYQAGSLYVPLSNGEEILDPELNAKWHAMCNKAKGQNPSSGPRF